MLLKQDPANRSLLNDNQVLTNELVNVNRELTKLKAEGRVMGDTYKKSEKENLELKKSITAKQNALDKLRKERDELWAIVNTDKYKSIQTIENDSKKSAQQLKTLEDEVQVRRQQLEEQSQQNEELLNKIKEVEYESQMLRERDMAREKLVHTLEGKSRRAEEQLDRDTSLATQSVQDSQRLKTENEQLKQDMSWLAN